MGLIGDVVFCFWLALGTSSVPHPNALEEMIQQNATQKLFRQEEILKGTYKVNENNR
jgi:hypothetical protein